MQLDLTPKRRLTSLIIAMALSPGVFAEEAAVENGMQPLDCVIMPSIVADLSSSVPGVLSDVGVGRNDLIERGQVVAELEPSVESVKVQLARTPNGMDAETHQRHVDSAFGGHGQLKTEHPYRSGTQGREPEARPARLSLPHSAQLEQRTGKIRRRRTIQSPISGVVVERFKTTGEYVADEPVVRVAQLDPLYVEVVVPVEHLDRVREGLRAKVWSEALPNKVWHPSVSLVDRVADVASGTYGVRLELPNPDYRVPAGLRCRVQFLQSTPEPAAVAAAKAPAFHPINRAAIVPAEAEVAAGQASTGETGTAPGKIGITRSYPTQVAAVETPLVGPGQAKKRTSDTTAQMSTAREETADTLLSSVDAALPTRCQRAGPFDDAQHAEHQAQEFRRSGFEVEIEKQSRLVQVGLRVMSQRMRNREAIKRYVERLLGAGVRDLYPVTSGLYKNHVALGLYKNPKPAQERVEELTAMGFEVELKPWRERKTEYFLAIRGLPAAQNTALLSGRPHPESDAASDSWTCEMLAARLKP